MKKLHLFVSMLILLQQLHCMDFTQDPSFPVLTSSQDVIAALIHEALHCEPAWSKVALDFLGGVAREEKPGALAYLTIDTTTGKRNLVFCGIKRDGDLYAALARHGQYCIVTDLERSEDGSFHPYQATSTQNPSAASEK